MGFWTETSGMGKPAEAETRTYRVRTPDGVTIHAREWGNPGGPEIVLIHGFMQSHRSWAKQTQSALADEFRLVAYDLRGHGESDKIMDPALYGDGARFADELAAVMDAAKLARPALVGWSYGSRVIADYLTKHGSRRVAGINYVGSALSDAAAHLGSDADVLRKTLTEDPAALEAATADFVRACFAKPPTAAEFRAILAFNMAVPPKIRRWLRRPAPYDAVLRAIDVPVLVTHGDEDTIMRPSLAAYVEAAVPGARASYYPGVGHSPFWEEPARFNAELAAFAREVAARR